MAFFCLNCVLCMAVLLFYLLFFVSLCLINECLRGNSAIFVFLLLFCSYRSVFNWFECKFLDIFWIWFYALTAHFAIFCTHTCILAYSRFSYSLVKYLTVTYICMYICIYKPWLEIRVGVKHLDTPLGLCKLTPRPYNVVTVTHDLAFVINPTVVKASVLATRFN